MQNAALMGVMDGATDRYQQLSGLAWRHGPAAKRLVQSSTLHQLHAIEAKAVALAYFEHRHNARVVQPGRRLRFNAEPLQPLGGRDLADGDALECDHPVQTLLPGPIDHTLAPAPHF